MSINRKKVEIGEGFEYKLTEKGISRLKFIEDKSKNQDVETKNSEIE